MRPPAGAAEVAARKLRKARLNLESAMRFAQKVGLAMLAEGHTEVDVAQQLGVNRMTVRKWAGK